jgi:toxin-antitoxin system PIN domain toxin
VIAVDTNVLVYAHRRDSEFHQPAADVVKALAESPELWAIPWPCLHEFYSVVTHARIYDPPTSPTAASGQIAAWLEAPSLVPISEGETYWSALSSLLGTGKVSGPLVHDARIAALCLSHGIRELWSADRDFSRFPRLKVTNPLVGPR